MGSLKFDADRSFHAANGGPNGSEGTGVMLYLNQERARIGLEPQDARLFPSRIRDLPPRGNHRLLGFEMDERDFFGLGSDILEINGFSFGTRC